MSRLIVVSNRVAVGSGPQGSTGGLAVALQSALRQHGGIWFGWSGKVAARASPTPAITEDEPITYVTVDLNRKDFDEYYNGFANRTLWPLFHYRLDLAKFLSQDYTGYQRVNALFARKLLPFLKSDDVIWIHDYHLVPLGQELRRCDVTQKLGFFLHTPFPAMEILTGLPSHRDLVRDLCIYDLVGFQTENDLRAFQDYIRHEADGTVARNGEIQAYGRQFRAGVFPIGVDTDSIIDQAQQSGKTSVVRRLQAGAQDVVWIIGVDRLDYSKGIPERFSAYQQLLEDYPAHRGNVRFIQITPPSRGEVPEYREIRQELERMTGHINGLFAELDWVPLNYLNKSYAQRNLIGFYRTSRIGLVTPLRDGMNLVAKEYVASQNPLDPGVLVLSRFAGAARELDAALIVNPFDTDDTAEALARGLDMSLEERTERWTAMMEKLRKNTLDHWLKSYLDALEAAPKRN